MEKNKIIYVGCGLLKKYWFQIMIVLFIIIKQFMVSGLPIIPLPQAMHDDAFLVNVAQSIGQGNWLGTYNEITFKKGPGFPLYLALCDKLDLSFVFTTSMLYSIGVILFVYSTMRILNNKVYSLILFIVLLFNPAASDWSNLQRVYRNGFTLALTLIFISLMLMMYLKREEKIVPNLVISVLAGVVLGILSISKDDTMWLYPFLYAVILVSVFKLFIRYRFSRQVIMRCIIFLLPIIIMRVPGEIVELKNREVYQKLESERDYESEAVEAMTAIKSNYKTDVISLPREALPYLYEASPTLKSIKDNMESCMDSWSQVDTVPDDGQVENGWIGWCIRAAVKNAGYYESWQITNDFYKKIYDELSTAYENKQIEKDVRTSSEYYHINTLTEIKRLMAGIWDTLKYMSSFEEVEVRVQVESIEREGQVLFENITNDSSFSFDAQTGRISSGNTYDSDKYQTAVYKQTCLNGVAKIYQKIGFLLFIIGNISFVVLFFYMILKIKMRQYEMIDFILISASCILNVVVLCAGITAVSLSSCPARTVMYLSSGYSLLLAFELLCLLKLFSVFCSWLRMRIRNRS